MIAAEKTPRSTTIEICPTPHRAGLDFFGDCTDLDNSGTGPIYATGPAGEGTAVVPVSQNEFKPREVRSFQTDDAMATGMIGVILGIAFSVLLALTIGVTLWTVSVSP